MSQTPKLKGIGLDLNRLVPMIGGALGLACVGTVLMLGALTRPARSRGELPTPVFTIVGLASRTPTPSAATPTPPGVPAIPSPTLPSGEGVILVPGDLVEVTGTGGEGLRLRRAAGLEADIVVLGVESEVFRVIAGPATADGYTWWQLVNPYDSEKQGWAVGLYLSKLGTNP
jgi:hypothetical protein